MVGRVAVAVLLLALRAAADAPAVELKVEVGIGGLARGGQVATVRVQLRSQTDVDGVLRVVAGDEGVHAVPYEVPLALASGARKAVEVPVLLPEGCACRVDFVAAGGAVLGSISPLVLDLHDEALVAVVGPNVLGVPLSALATPQVSQAVLVQASDLPSHWAGLVPVSLLAVDDRSWNGLEPEQRSAARRWIERGGHLVLGLSDPTLPEVRPALDAWMGRHRDLVVAGDPPRVDLDACGGESMLGAVHGEIGRRFTVGSGSVSLIGIGADDPRWGAKGERETFWHYHALNRARAASAGASPSPELSQVATPSVLLGMIYYIAAALLACAFVGWHMYRVRMASRGAVASVVPRTLGLGIVGALLTLGAMAGHSWRVGETRCEEVTDLRRCLGAEEWSVESGLRLESRWGWGGSVRFEGDDGVAGLTGPRIEHVRAPWRRSSALDDAFAGTGRPGAPLLRLMGGDRVIAWGRGTLSSRDLDALELSHGDDGHLLVNRGALTYRNVSLVSHRGGAGIPVLPPGASALLLAKSSGGGKGPWAIRGEIVDMPPLWEVGDGIPCSSRTVRFERSWP